MIAKTYPAAAANLLGIPILGKTSRVTRQAAGPDIDRVCGALAISRSVGLAAAIADGFGPRPSGEDPFDALLGLLGMIAVVTGAKPHGIGAGDEPAHVRTVEGWILGVPARPASTTSDGAPREP